MRITEALKPVTDMLAAVGMSLDTATYKDGKLHVILNTEAPKVTGKPGSGPEYPPEGYQLLETSAHRELVCGEGWKDSIVWHLSRREWVSCIVRPDPRIMYTAFAVSIAPKPEPVRLTDQEKLVGWRDPNGFRMQTFQSRDVECVVCKKTIKAGERLALWRHRFPEAFEKFVPGKDIAGDHHHAHVDCLYKARGAHAVHGLSYAEVAVPFWLQEKRQKYDAQQSTP